MMILWPLRVFVCKLLCWSLLQNREITGKWRVLSVYTQWVQTPALTKWLATGWKTLLLVIYFSSSEIFSILVALRLLMLDCCLCFSRRWIVSLGPWVYLTKVHFSESHRDSTFKDSGVEHMARNSYLENGHFWLKYQCCHLLWRGSECYKWHGLIWSWSQQITHPQ